MKIKNRKIFNISLLILWMIIIFAFSHQNGNESSEKSQLVIHIFSYLGIDINSVFGNMADFIVRKGAHMTEYFILSFFAYKVLKVYEIKVANWISVIFCFLYACSDEFHQTFIVGRMGCFKDVMIDTTGAIICALMIMLINRRKKIIYDNKRNNLNTKFME